MRPLKRVVRPSSNLISCTSSGIFSARGRRECHAVFSTHPERPAPRRRKMPLPPRCTLNRALSPTATGASGFPAGKIPQLFRIRSGPNPQACSNTRIPRPLVYGYYQNGGERELHHPPMFGLYGAAVVLPILWNPQEFEIMKSPRT